ncbi:MAG: zinc ABC transporter substrate-binding protein [Sphaerochaetaceae bacterium]
MNKKIALFVFILLVTLALVSAGGTGERQGEKSKPLIALSILPQQYAVNRIGGELVETVVLVGPGQNPHNWEMNPRQMTLLNESDAWVLSGVDFENSLVPKIASLYPRLKIIDGTAGVTFRSLEEHSAADHLHDSEIDRHSWLGREPMKIMARHIEAFLSSFDQQNSAIYKKNLEIFLADIDTLFDSLKTKLAPLKGSNVLVYHPSFGYLFDEFGLVQKAIETGGKEPTAKNLTAIIEEAKKEGTRAIFVQAQFPLSSAQSIAKAINAQVLPLDPLAYDWLENIALIGNTLYLTLQGGE